MTHDAFGKIDESSSEIKDLIIDEKTFRNMSWDVRETHVPGLSELQARAGGASIMIRVVNGDPRLEMRSDSGGRLVVERLDSDEMEAIAWERFDDFLATGLCPGCEPLEENDEPG